MSELKPCMSCKSTDVIVKTYTFSVNGKEYVNEICQCQNCGMMSRAPRCHPEYAITRWNTRPAEDALYSQMAELYCEMYAMRAALFEIANFGKGQPFKFRTKAEYIDNFRLIQKMAKDVLNKYAPDMNDGKMEEK